MSPTIMSFFSCVLSFVALSLATPAYAQPAGFKIFWWNIEKGITNRAQKDNPLNEELRRRANAQYDVIALGEFEYEAIDSKTFEALDASYNEHFIPYNPHTPDTGIAVYIRKDIKAEMAPLQELDWSPTQLQSEDWKEAYRAVWLKEDYEAYLYSRYYIRFKLQKGFQTLNFIPIHLSNPWVQIKKRFGGEMGKIAVGLSLLFGTENPLMYQVSRLLQAIRSDLGPELNFTDSETVILGDFNDPEKIGPFRTRFFKTMRKMWRSLFDNKTASFPRPEAETYGKYPPLKIDHGFSSPDANIVSASILDVRGSDHNPAEIVTGPHASRSKAYCEAKLLGDGQTVAQK